MPVAAPSSDSWRIIPSFARPISAPCKRTADVISNTVTVMKGATGDLRARLDDHRSSVVEQAALAVKLARIAAVKSATYRRTTGARHLYDEAPTFRAAFNKARARIRAMRVRYVVVGEEEEADGMR